MENINVEKEENKTLPTNQKEINYVTVIYK